MALKQTNNNHINISSIGQKVVTGAKTGMEIAGALKSIYELGKGLYTAGRTIAAVAPAVGLL